MENANQLIYFIGKGGVGKSTLSVLTALNLSQSGYRTLLVSLDPAHNLSDILETEIRSAPGLIADNLYGQEVDADEWIRRYLQGLEKRLQSSYRYLSSFNLDKQFATIKLAPGMEEYGMLLAMQNILRKAEDFDYIVVDMPPTGLALRFFNLPRLSVLWLKKLLELREEILKNRKIIHNIQFGGFNIEKDKLTLHLQQQLDFYEKIIRIWQSNAAYFNIVINNDTLSVKEALRIITSLKDNGFESMRVVINKFSGGDPREIKQSFSPIRCIEMPLSSTSLYGLGKLKIFRQENAGLLTELALN